MASSEASVPMLAPVVIVLVAVLGVLGWSRCCGRSWLESPSPSSSLVFSVVAAAAVVVPDAYLCLPLLPVPSMLECCLQVVFTDDMAVDPVGVLRDVLEFLDLELTSDDESEVRRQQKLKPGPPILHVSQTRIFASIASRRCP